MEEKLIQRLESAVQRLESLSSGFRYGSTGISGDGDDNAQLDPSISAYQDLIDQFVGRILSAAENIGGNVLEATKVLEEAFSVQKELLIKVKQCQVGFMLNTNFFIFLICFGI